MSYKRRKDSKREISFKTSLFRFSLAFVIVFVAGIVSNIYIQKVDLESRLPKEIMEAKDFQVSVDDLEIRFKKGIFPIIGLFSKRVEWKDKNCSSRRVVAQDVFLILDFISLFKAELKPGRIDVAYAEVTTPEHCTTLADVEEGVVSSGKNVNSSQVVSTQTLIEKKIKEKSPEEVFQAIGQLKAFEYFPMVNVKRFDFKYLKGYREDVVVKGQLLLRKKKDIRLTLQLNQLMVRGYELPLNKAKLQIAANDEGTSLELSSRVREGLLTFTGNVVNNKKYDAFLKFHLEKLPLSPFSLMLFDKVQVSYLWLNCKAEVSAPWNKIQDVDFSFKDCGLNGPYGSAQVQSSQLNLKKIKQLDVELNKFQVDKILKSKREAYFSGVFSKYGNFSSAFKFKDGVWSAKGFLQDSELIFSRNNLRDIQKLTKLPFSLKGNRKTWQVSIKGVELDEGIFEGEMSAQFKDGFNKAQGRVSIHKLLLRPEIYQLMILSKPTPLSFYGKVKVDNKKVSDWSGLVAAKNLQANKYKFSALKIEGRQGKDESAQFKFYSPGGAISKDSELIQWAQPTTLVQEWTDDDYRFKEFSLRLDLAKDKNIHWKRGYLKFANGWQLSSEGQLTPDQQTLDLWIQWDKPNRNYLKWTHNGKFLAPGWIPDTKWVKDWLEKNPDFLKRNKSINFAVVESKKMTDDLNEMGKKTIEKVKDVLSIKKSDKKKGS